MLIIGRIFASEIWGAYFREGFQVFFFGGGVRGDVGVLIIEVLQQSLSKLNHYLWAYVNAK